MSTRVTFGHHAGVPEMAAALACKTYQRLSALLGHHCGAMYDREQLALDTLVGAWEATQTYEEERSQPATWIICKARGALREGFRQQSYWNRKDQEEIRARIQADQPLEGRMLPPLSLEDFVCADYDDEDRIAFTEVLRADDPDPADLAAERWDREHLARVIGWLPEMERRVIRRYYFDGLTLKQIAAEIDRSESRAHQLHAQAIGRLRVYLGAEVTHA